MNTTQLEQSFYLDRPKKKPSLTLNFGWNDSQRILASFENRWSKAASGVEQSQRVSGFINTQYMAGMML
jgi:hypothetical protein